MKFGSYSHFFSLYIFFIFILSERLLLSSEQLIEVENFVNSKNQQGQVTRKIVSEFISTKFDLSLDDDSISDGMEKIDKL